MINLGNLNRDLLLKSVPRIENRNRQITKVSNKKYKLELC